MIEGRNTSILSTLRDGVILCHSDVREVSNEYIYKLLGEFIFVISCHSSCHSNFSSALLSGQAVYPQESVTVGPMVLHQHLVREAAGVHHSGYYLDHHSPSYSPEICKRCPSFLAGVFQSCVRQGLVPTMFQVDLESVILVKPPAVLLWNCRHHDFAVDIEEQQRQELGTEDMCCVVATIP